MKFVIAIIPGTRPNCCVLGLEGVGFHSLKMCSGEASFVEVAARVRPVAVGGFSDEEVVESKDEKRSTFAVSPSAALISHEDAMRGEREFPFDHVFGEKESNEDIFVNLVESKLRNFLSGFNATVFAYGQTGSGKTFTISDLLRRSVRFLFHELNSEKHWLLRISYCEVYNEQIFDLLQGEIESCNPLKILCDDPIHGAVLDELHEFICSSEADVMSLVKKGEQNRHFRSTKMNAQSSRSHTIFKLIVEKKGKQEEITTSALSFVDLAGSERQTKAGTSGNALREGRNINKSLLALREVITNLAEKNAFVPYRNSKLTRLLKHSLGGNSQTTLLCTINPSPDHEAESLNTLDFGKKCQKVQNFIHRNNLAGEHSLLQKLRGNIGSLEEELEAQRKRTQAIEEELARFEKEEENESIAEKYAVKAQRWFRKTELENLHELRSEAKRQRKRVCELEATLEMEKNTKLNMENGFSFVVQSKNTASMVLNFAKRIGFKKESKRLHDIKAWEEEMRQWYAGSLEYNEETQERARMVENEAVRIEQESIEGLSHLSRKEAAFGAFVRKQRMEFENMQEQLERTEEDLALRMQDILRREQQLAERELGLERSMASSRKEKESLAVAMSSAQQCILSMNEAKTQKNAALAGQHKLQLTVGQLEEKILHLEAQVTILKGSGDVQTRNQTETDQEDAIEAQLDFGEDMGDILTALQTMSNSVSSMAYSKSAIERVFVRLVCIFAQILRSTIPQVACTQDSFLRSLLKRQLSDAKAVLLAFMAKTCEVHEL